jgi:methylase of polypeptide subunit release factors
MKTGEDRIATLRPALFEAGYTLPAVQRVLGADRLLSSREEELIIFERRLAGDSALSLAGRLFLLNRDVDRAAWDRALPGLSADSLVEMGLASTTGGVLTASVRLVPHGEVYIASDRVDEAKDPEHVTGINNPAVLLSDLAVRRRVGLGLDLGCGGGIQSLLMSRHCEHVIATDLNPRALEFTQLNAQINGVTNIETRLGSFFEPVEGLAFDLVLCNPPYVISPVSQFLYRDSGMPADSLCRQLVGEVGLHLAEGGYGQLLVSWVQPEQRPWAAVLEEWLGDAPCDAWFLHYSTEDPLSNAAKWNRPLRFAELAGFGEAVDRWTAYFRENSIDAIGFGSVTLRRRSNAVNWRRADELREGHNSASDHIQRVFVAEDLLRGLADDDGIMETRCRLAPGHRLEQTMVEGPDGGWQPLQTRLVMTEGLGFQGSLDLPLAQVLQHLDGRRTLAEAVTVAAAEMGIAGAEVVEFRHAAASTVRRLLELGFLEPE